MASGSDGYLGKLLLPVLEVACGHRLPKALDSRRYSKSVQLHAAAWHKRNRMLAHKYGPRRRTVSTEIKSLHLREAGEFFGTTALAGRIHGFSGRLHGGALVVFRIL